MTRQVGRSLPRLESEAKVTGRAEYVHNLTLPGMVYGKFVRSTVAHGRIRHIDARQAEQLPGVLAVITAAEVARIVKDPYYGPAFHDQPVLAVDKVHYVGDPVALVVGEDRDALEAAADLVTVEYEELPAVFDERAAAEPGAPVIHEVIRPAATFTDLKNLKPRSGSNVAMAYQLRHGDLEAGFAQADYIFEDEFHSHQVTHTPLEPIVTVADPRSDGGLDIYTSSQSPSFVRMELARLLNWPENRIRVRTAYLGGGFGAKLYMKLEPLAAVAALLLRRPVKLSLSMEEQFYTITRHGATVRLKTGVTRDGRMVARACTIWWNGGAYADIGPRVTQKSGFTAAGPYDIPHVYIDSYAVYTNLPPAGALRGFGIPQLVWAYESQADLIAHRLGIDPWEFRWKNALRPDRPHATGTLMRDAGVLEVLQELKRLMRWDEPFDRGGPTRRRGRGIAIGLKAAITPTTSVAIVNLYGDGSGAIYSSTVDMGQGSDTVLAQLAAEVLGLDARSIRVVHPDTDVTPYDMATLGSRSTYHMGNAVLRAAEEVRRQLTTIGSEIFRCRPEEVELRDGHLVVGEKRVSFKEAMEWRFGMQAGNLIGVGSFTPTYKKPDPNTGESEDITTFWMVGGNGAEVEVDTETGRVTVTKLVTVGDAGKALNPGVVRTQLSGAALMQLGFTLFEEMRFEDGQVINASLADYKLLGMRDLPASVVAEFVEVGATHGPFGAKGIGEVGSLAVSPAVANAVFDAVGVRITSLPLTPEKVLRALKEQAGEIWEEVE